MHNSEKELATLRDDPELLHQARLFRRYAGYATRMAIFNKLDWLAYLGLFETEMICKTIFDQERP